MTFRSRQAPLVQKIDKDKTNEITKLPRSSIYLLMDFQR